MDSLEDRALSFAAIGLVAALGWRMMATPAKTPVRHEPTPAVIGLPLQSRVTLLAEAIATSEGYYASGVYDGHSLPYFLNNPGLLKATPIVWGDPPTWSDTGLLVFDTPDIGWAALRHQVCLMLTGTSRFYAPNDSLQAVGIKYAAGDPNWGVNVASYLRLSPAITLAELSHGLPDGLTCQAA
jgi:hypothetical protein